MHPHGLGDVGGSGFLRGFGTSFYERLYFIRLRTKTFTWISSCIQGVCDTPLHWLIADIHIFYSVSLGVLFNGWACLPADF